jgi:hypothetical protein
MMPMENLCADEIRQICETLKPMGRFKVYGNDGKKEDLSFQPRKEYAGEQATDFVVGCLHQIGFTDVCNDKTKKDFYHSVRATIKCEYDSNTGKIQSADVRDIRALCYVIQYLNPWVTIFVPGANKQQLPFAKHKTALLNYLQKHGK